MFGSINLSHSDDPFNKDINGVQINTNWSDNGGKSTLSLNTEELPAGRSLNLTCQNIELKTEDSITYGAWEGEGTS